MNARKYILFVTALTFSVSCTNDSESDLTNYKPIGTVTYNGIVKTIVTENCIRCHAQPPQNGAPMPLLTYDNLKDAVLHRGLINRITSFDASFGMPYGGPRLPELKIDQIKKWSDDNFPE